MKTDSGNIFLIGAGFTRAVFPQAPLNPELLETISSDGGSTLTKYKDKYNTNDIEKLLTQLDLEITENDKLREDRDTINSEISSFFRKFRFSRRNCPTWLKTFALNILNQNDSIVCLNYDCLLEGALDNFGIWSPNGGYSKVHNPLADSLPVNSKNICIYKIHGSENFVKSSLMGENPDQTVIMFDIDPTIYPRSGAHCNFGGGVINAGPYIIAPSFVKTPHVTIAVMMLDLLRVADEAKNFVIIGCGMRPEDNFLWLLLIRFLIKDLDKPCRLVILDPASENIWKRISNYWIGDICTSCQVSTVPCGIEDGTSKLESILKSDKCQSKAQS